jgi:hypothetical protein
MDGWMAGWIDGWMGLVSFNSKCPNQFGGLNDLSFFSIMTPVLRITQLHVHHPLIFLGNGQAHHFCRKKDQTEAVVFHLPECFQPRGFRKFHHDLTWLVVSKIFLFFHILGMS